MINSFGSYYFFYLWFFKDCRRFTRDSNWFIINSVTLQRRSWICAYSIWLNFGQVPKRILFILRVWIFDILKWKFLPRTEALATEIFNDCGNEPLICLCVLKGGYKFFADLTERIQNRNRTNGTKSLPMMIDFIRLKSYHVSFIIPSTLVT